MDNIYIIIVVILMALAVSDLIVGVSNDAVNFLNSALGSKAAPRYVIMTVASVGILLGSFFSSGMMEVARNGVFHPSAFSFNDIMMLFLAVMLSDVIILDLFNTFGLPTSTTVSLVFELLGAAVAVALVNIWEGTGAAELATYMNSSKAMGIISGILMSVVIAFVCGSFVMYLTRAIFTFHYKKTFRAFGSIWCGIALTAITYFAVFKGLKGSSVVNADLMAWMNEHTMTILGMSVVGWTVIMGLIQILFKRVNILKITVLAGTLSLALAFAGNDLVNFIGVFMAGFESYNIASSVAAAGGDVASLTMGQLAAPVVANPWILMGAGSIMVVTLWFSKKARSVTETEINLARQDSGVERFGSTPISRTIVRGALNFNKRYEKYVPKRVQEFVSSRFEPMTIDEQNQAPFDLIRATVNLSVASILISMATSLKLPLSTTYVTFMVAMGSSLADKAWGRESAVYRITGVLTVISGWFLTAFIAFTIALCVGFALMYGGIYAIFGLTILCAAILVQSNILHKRRTKKHEMAETANTEIEFENIADECEAKVVDAMQKMTTIYNQTLIGLFTEDRKLLKNMVRESEEMYQIARHRKYQILPTLHKLQQQHIETGQYYVQVADYLNEVAKSLVHITRPSFEHIDNNHEGLTKAQVEDLMLISKEVSDIYGKINVMLKNNDFTHLDDVLQQRDQLFEKFANAIKKQIKRVIDEDNSSRATMLYLAIINETKTMILQSRNLLKSQKYFVEQRRQ